MFTNTFIREIRRMWTRSRGTSDAAQTPLQRVVAVVSPRVESPRRPNKLNCGSREKDKSLTPLLARKTPSSDGSTKEGKRRSGDVVAASIACAACAVVIAPQDGAAIMASFTQHPLTRSCTPPHIAQGRGNKAVVEPLMLL